MKKFSSIDEYILSAPKEVQKKLESIRQIVKEAAPEANEKISYGMPAFNLNGKRLLYFGAFKNHVSLFPASSAANAAFKKDLADYETSKGTVRFPLDKPLPLTLIHQIVEYRVKENQTKKK